MNKIEKDVNRAYTHATPDTFNQVEQSCQSTVQTAAVRRSKVNMVWKVATCALALILVVAAIFGGVTIGNQTASAASITLDVNPSISIEINKNKQVIDIQALNTDGETILADIQDDAKGSSLKLVVYAIIGSMYSNGYLNENANSVLVSVDSGESMYDEIVSLVSNEIQVSLKGNGIEASVVTQYLTNSKEASDLAQKYGISKGKAELIQKILAKTDADGNALYTEDQLVTLSVNELGIILGNLGLENVGQEGESSKKQYIDEDVALQAALTQVALTDLEKTALSQYQCKLDLDDGVIAYELEFVYDGYEYEFSVGAMSGTVIKTEKSVMKYSPDTTATELSKDEIIAKAKAAAGIAETEEVTASCRLSGYIGVKVYTVWFDYNSVSYEFEMDAYGTVLAQETELLTVSADDTLLSRAEAEAKFDAYLESLGYTQLDEWGKITTAVTSDGVYVYQLTLVRSGSDNTKVVIQMDAKTGEIIGTTEEESKSKLDDFFQDMKDWGHGFDHDFDDWDDMLDDMFDDMFDDHDFGGHGGGQHHGEHLSQKQIEEIVLKYLGITDSSAVVQIDDEADNEGGLWIIEVEVVYNGTEYAIELNAVTGSIIKSTSEPAD